MPKMDLLIGISTFSEVNCVKEYNETTFSSSLILLKIIFSQFYIKPIFKQMRTFKGQFIDI